jgi:5-carboxymethyl-2-hydroxymuconate isomerase
MPHFSVEYSSNLDDKVDIQGVCDAIHAAALQTGIFELGALRIRAIRCTAFAIADRVPENTFIDISLRVGPGRSSKVKKSAGDIIFSAVGDFLAPLFERPHFALSFAISETDGELSWKRNSMHPRLRAK